MSFLINPFVFGASSGASSAKLDLTNTNSLVQVRKGAKRGNAALLIPSPFVINNAIVPSRTDFSGTILTHKRILNRGVATKGRAVFAYYGVVPPALTEENTAFPSPLWNNLKKRGALLTNLGPNDGTGGTIPPAVTDPLFSLVVFLTDGEGNDGDLVITDQSSFAHVMTSPGSGTQVSNTQAEYGSTSIKSHNTTPFGAPDSNAWDISSNNSDEFCVEYSYYQTDRGSTYDAFSQLPNGGDYAWLSRHNSTDWIFYWTSDGSSFQTLTAVGGVGTANAWHKYCIEKNSSGKLRLYLDGAMLTSSTPADSTIHHSSGSMVVNAAGAAQDAWLDNGRITKGASGSGAARYNSDAGYTPATRPFPIS